MTEPRALNETIFVSPRMRCRRWRRDDLAGIMQVYGDADAMRYVGDGLPIPPEHAVSQRVLEKAGMRLQRERENEDGSRTLVYGCALWGREGAADQAGA